MMMMMMMMIMMMTRKSDLNSERSLTLLLSAKPVNLIVRFMNMYTVVISVTGHLLSSKKQTRNTAPANRSRVSCAHNFQQLWRVYGKGKR